MTAIYLESSALLSWLFGEPGSREVIRAVDGAQTVVTSVLTIVEAERALRRAENSRLVTEAQAEKLRGMLAHSKAQWLLMGITDEVCLRAGGIFPAEPIRTLDAIHLSTALLFMRVFPDLQLCSFDERIRANTRLLGIEHCD